MSRATISGVTGVILAGGGSRRMGEDKSFVPFLGRPLIEGALGRLSLLFEDLVIVTNAPEAYVDYPARVEGDALPGCGPLGGIYTGLLCSSGQRCFVVGCDMPFVSEGLAAHMVSLSDGCDVVVAEFEGKLQTLCAVYGEGCIEPIKSQLSEGNKRVFDFYESVRVRVIDAVEVARFDPLGISFVNINTPEDRRRYGEPRGGAAEAAAVGGRR